MSTDQTEGTRNADVASLRGAEAHATDLAGTPAPAYADVTDNATIKKLPIVPVPLRRENIKGTVTRAAGLGWHRARYHGFRSPVYLLVYLFHAGRGAVVLGGKLAAWLHWGHGWILESQAVARGHPGHHDAMNAHRQRQKTTVGRAKIAGVGLGLTVVVLGLMARFSPKWGWLLAGIMLLVVLARHGKPEGRRLIRRAVVPPQYQPLSQDVVIRALGSLGIAGINQVLREGRDIQFVTPVARDGHGYRVAVDLPYGVTVAEVVERREKLASGLRRPLGCVWPEPASDEHAGRLVLYVADEPLNKQRQPQWPLANTPKASLFNPIPFGTDQRGKPVTLTLMFANLLIGSISRMGKTVAMRNVLLAACLDPLAEIHAWELKGTGDLDMIGKVAHAYGSGADDETIEAALADLRRVHAELDRRAKAIKGLGKDICPDSKVTPQLAAKRSLRLHPIVFAVDECQEAFSHPEFKDEYERLCLQLIRRGPALGIMLLLSTQRPDAKSLPTGITANVAMRFCLRVMDQVANDMVLGTSAYKRGINAALFGIADKGVGWAIGFSDIVHSQVVKSYYVNGPAAERIAVRARSARELAGTLGGFAAGSTDLELPRSFAADVLAVFGGDAKLWCSTIAARLAARLPGVYPSITAAAVGSQLRAWASPSRTSGSPARRQRPAVTGRPSKR